MRVTRNPAGYWSLILFWVLTGMKICDGNSHIALHSHTSQKAVSVLLEALVVVVNFRNFYHVKDIDKVLKKRKKKLVRYLL